MASSDVIKRRSNKALGIFIDGVGLDLASKRLERRIDWSKLVKSISGGINPTVVRYYTLIPHQDDSRQKSFLDSVAKKGIEVVVRRLPPQNVERQASISVEMAADIIAFTSGCNNFSDFNLFTPDSVSFANPAKTENTLNGDEKRVVTVVCPSREIAYAIGLAKELKADTISADFRQANGDVLKSASKWLDLSDIESIWMAE